MLPGVRFKGSGLHSSVYVVCSFIGFGVKGLGFTVGVGSRINSDRDALSLNTPGTLGCRSSFVGSVADSFKHEVANVSDMWRVLVYSRAPQQLVSACPV